MKNILLHTALICCCLLLLAPTAYADEPKLPTAWWPDPSTGIMWASTDNGQNIDYQGAGNYCKSLSLNGDTDWRLPTLAEIDAATNMDGEWHSFNWWAPNDSWGYSVWTSTTLSNGSIDTVKTGQIGWRRLLDKSKPTSKHRAFCVRTMEPDLLSLAKQFKINKAISSKDVLTALTWSARFEASLHANNYQDAANDAKQVITLDPQSCIGYFDLGQVDGYLGQWDDAVTNAQSESNRSSTAYFQGCDPTTSSWGLVNWARLNQGRAKTDPNVTAVWTLILKADTARDANQFQDSAAVANQVIQMEPAWPEGYERLGLAYAGTGQWDAAIEQIKKANSLDKVGEVPTNYDLQSIQQSRKKASH